MQKTIFILLFVFYSGMQAFSQTQYIPACYERTIIYENNYDKSLNYIGKDTSFGLLWSENGFLCGKTKTETVLLFNEIIVPGLDTIKNFQIDFAILIQDNIYNSFGLIWNRNDDKYCFFGTSSAHSYPIIESNEKDANKFDTLCKSNYSHIHPSGNLNYFTIRKIGNEISFYTNGDFSGKILNYSKPISNIISFGTDDKIDFKIDYVRVYQLTTMPFKIFSQKHPESDYNYKLNKETIFSDDFDSKNKDLYEEYDKMNSSFKNGYLNLNMGQQGCFVTKKLPLIYSDNFEIETNIKGTCKEGTWTNPLYGLSTNNYQTPPYFGFPSMIDFQMFPNLQRTNWMLYFNKNYQLIKAKLLDASFNEPVIKADDYNKLTIRKLNNVIYFFVNETLLYACYDLPLDPSIIGFNSPNKGSEYSIDYIKVYKIIK